MFAERTRKAKYYHALNLLPSLGPVRIRKLTRYFGHPEAAWKATPSELLNIEGFNRNLAERMINERKSIDLEMSWAQLLRGGQSYITWDDDDYPAYLREIYDPPPLLYVLGDIAIAGRACLAIVGSRRHTIYGREIAYNFAAELSNYGITIVSGMARGIDTWAHKGALDAGGKTVAVLGCSLDLCYPPENKLIKEKIRNSGAVISEFPPVSKPLPQNFPRRNRIISGLAQGTIVVEAGEKSGALITAGFALEQGREVFAVPGGINSPYSKGCHKLIKEGAKLVERVEDILEEFLFFGEREVPFSAAEKKHVPEKNNLAEQLPFNTDELKLLEVIPYEPVTLEEIATLSKLPLALVNSLLLDLELKGIIKQLPGKYFVRS